MTINEARNEFNMSYNPVSNRHRIEHKRFFENEVNIPKLQGILHSCYGDWIGISNSIAERLPNSLRNISREFQFSARRLD
jgi:hypothetical protein